MATQDDFVEPVWPSPIVRNLIILFLVMALVCLVVGAQFGTAHNQNGLARDRSEPTHHTAKEQALLEENAQLKSENQYLFVQYHYWEGVANYGSDANPIQSFAVGEVGNAISHVAPRGWPLEVAARFEPGPVEHETNGPGDPGLVFAITAGGKKIVVPNDCSWVRLNSLLLVRLYPDPESRYLSYSYEYDDNGDYLDYPVTVTCYRTLETSISPDFVY